MKEPLMEKATQYIAITGYRHGNPIFSKETVWASDQVSAKILFEMMDIMCCDVIVYVKSDEIYDKADNT